MKKSDFIKIIKEEISTVDFDFLGNEKQQKEDENLKLLNNEDLQKQFICDFLLDKKDKYEITEVVESTINDWKNDGYLNITYGVEISYHYDSMKEPVRFGLWFEGKHIEYSIDGDYERGVWAGTMPDSIPPSGGNWFSEINWSDIDVQMFMVDERDDDIEFIAFKKAPERIQNLFICHFLEEFINKYSDIGLRTPEQYDNINKTGYC